MSRRQAVKWRRSDLCHSLLPGHRIQAPCDQPSITLLSDNRLVALAGVNVSQGPASPGQRRAEANALSIKGSVEHWLTPCYIESISKLHLVVLCRRAAPDEGQYPYPTNTPAWQAIQGSFMGTAADSWRTTIGYMHSDRRIQLCFPGMHLSDSCLRPETLQLRITCMFARACFFFIGACVKIICYLFVCSHLPQWLLPCTVSKIIQPFLV